MPRFVDHEDRRAALAAAVWRVVARDGIDGASVRRVADEAGLSVGSLRYFFSTQAQLLTFALDLVGQRLEGRLVAVRERRDLDPVGLVTAMVEEMLPLDEARRLECRVWLAFAARSLVDATLEPTQRQLDERLSHAFAVMVAVLDEAGLLRADLDRELEAERLCALVDGLILRGLVRGPDGCRAVVGAHIREIAGGA